LIPLERTAAVLLAAGQSLRFGKSDKLTALLRGKPLAAHVAGLLSNMPMLGKFAVIEATEGNGPLASLLRDNGFDLVENPFPERGQDTSVRLGLARALESGPEAVLICLADMPNVTDDHFRALASAADADRTAISSTGAWRSPPTLIPMAIARLILAEPTKSVRSMIKPAVEVVASPSILADVDEPADLSGAGSRP
jgi:molybdenum cofactor cytidylyltransferase